MPRKKTSEVHAIIAAIESSNSAAKVIADAVAKELAAHTALDDARHLENKQTLAAISADVKSLLESRSFSLGIWRAVVTGGGIIGGAIALGSFLLEWIRGWAR